MRSRRCRSAGSPSTPPRSAGRPAPRPVRLLGRLGSLLPCPVSRLQGVRRLHRLDGRVARRGAAPDGREGRLLLEEGAARPPRLTALPCSEAAWTTTGWRISHPSTRSWGDLRGVLHDAPGASVGGGLKLGDRRSAGRHDRCGSRLGPARSPRPGGRRRALRPGGTAAPPQKRGWAGAAWAVSRGSFLLAAHLAGRGTATDACYPRARAGLGGPLPAWSCPSRRRAIPLLRVWSRGWNRRCT